MHRHFRGIRFFTSASSSTKTNWDPTVALGIEHPTLILLEKCISRNQLKQILAQTMRTNLITQTFPMSRLLYFTAISQPENLDIAIPLFNHFTPHPNLYIYNIMISALSNNQSFVFYNSMIRCCIRPDKHTMLHLVKASQHLLHVKQVNCHVIVMGFSSYGYLQNSLLKVYMDNGEMGTAQKMFWKMPVWDVVSFNVMIVGYARKGFSLEALELFSEMASFGVEADDYTLLGLLVCCGKMEDARLGKSVHAWIQKRKLISSLSLILGNALLDMYVKCKELEIAGRIFNVLREKDIVSWNTIIAGCAKVEELELARSFFDRMPSRDIVSWNSLIACYGETGDYRMVRKILNSMIVENVQPDNVTLVNLVSAAAETGALHEGRWIHGWVVRMQMVIDAFLGSALIDMYSKCGSIERALMVFKGLTEKDVTVWTAMITGLAFHGNGGKALELFSEMKKNITPNNVTFVAVLLACSHSGLVDQGLRIFNSMKEVYGIEPGIQHYGCLVDLFGRSGRLAEAKDVIENMPIKPSWSSWGAILSACRAQRNVETAELALTKLQKLEPEKDGGYVLLSNMYAACGKWSYSDQIREVMESRGVKKTAGCSRVIVDGVIHDFVAADKRHPAWTQIISTLNSLKCKMKFGADNFSLDFL